MVEFSRRGFIGTVGAAFGTAAVLSAPRVAQAVQGIAEQDADALSGLVRSTQDGWELENDVIRVRLEVAGGGVHVASLWNKAAGKEYQTASGGRALFEFELNGADWVSSESGWSIGEVRSEALFMYLKDAEPRAVGRALSIPLTRTAPLAFGVTLVVEIYDGAAGVRFQTFVKNGTSSNLTITNSVVLALAFPDEPHTLHYPPNSVWTSTRGSLSLTPADTSSYAKRAELPRKVISVYDSGDGWSLSPETNWKTQLGKGTPSGGAQILPAWAGLDVWASTDHAQIVTDPRCLQLVLFPGEEFEYIGVNVTVFAGGLVEGKMAEQEHFRKRFRYNHTTTIFNSNDWDYRGGGAGAVLPQDYYYNTIIPKVEAAGLDMVMLDDYWNTTRDTIEPSDDMKESIHGLEEFGRTLHDKGLLFGLWFSLSGGGHNEGRDLADPANIAFKKSQIETLIEDYYLSHQMVDLTEWWQNDQTTSYSHPSDNVYRKAVLSRQLLNGLVEEHPHFLPKLTSELDIFPSPTDRNDSLMHVMYNGWNTAGCGVTGEALSLITAVTLFGHLPMEATYVNNGTMSGKMEDYYAYMVARNTKFPENPGDDAKWPAAAVSLMGAFNRWRRHPRTVTLTENVWRPVYLGRGWDGSGTWYVSSGPFVWMYTDDARDTALMIATGREGYASTVVATPRWLDHDARYLVADITMDDTGAHTYAFRGVLSGAALGSEGMPVDLRENTSRGKAFWFQKVTGDGLQIVYVDENVDDVEARGTRGSIRISLQGRESTVATVIVADPITGRGAVVTVPLNAQGKGGTVVLAASLHDPAPVRTHFAEPVVYEAETLAMSTTGAATFRIVDEGGASGGKWVIAENVTTDGEALELIVDVETAGTYEIDVRYKENADRGRSRLYIDGTAFGPEVNHRPPDANGTFLGSPFRERRAGILQLSAGSHRFSFRSTGPGAGGSGRSIGVDHIKLTTSVLPSVTSFEAESVYSAASNAALVSSVGDTAASPATGGAWHKLAATSAGAWVEYTVQVPAAGRYRIATMTKQHRERGQMRLSVGGTDVGEVVDLCLASGADYAYTEFVHGHVDVAAAGALTLRYTVTGKNPASTGFTLAIDQISVLPEPVISAPETVDLAPWQSVVVTPELRGFEARYGALDQLYWWVVESSRDEVVTVDQNGRIRASASGTATVRVESDYDERVFADIHVTVA